MAMMDELTEVVGRAAGVDPAQAALAVGGMLRFLASRLPSPLFGEIQARLSAQDAPGSLPVPSGPETRV